MNGNDFEVSPFFNELPQPVKKEAYENLAYELLDSYLSNYEGEDDLDFVTERLVRGLGGSTRPDLVKAINDWEAYALANNLTEMGF